MLRRFNGAGDEDRRKVQYEMSDETLCAFASTEPAMKIAGRTSRRAESIALT